MNTKGHIEGDLEEGMMGSEFNGATSEGFLDINGEMTRP